MSSLFRKLTFCTSLFAAIAVASLVRAQTTDAPPAATAAPAAASASASASAAAAPAPAPAADAAPSVTVDPSGGTTGLAGDASGGSGAYTYGAAPLSEPTPLTGDDAKNPDKVKAYKDAKDAYDTQQKEPYAIKIAEAIGHNRVSINFVWTLITGFLVMFMQAGFAMVETGLCRAKNAAHTMTMNMLIYPLGMLGFWICGFAFMFGNVGMPGAGTLGMSNGLNHGIVWHLMGHDWNILGLKGFFLGGFNKGDTYDAGIFTLFLFQMVFMDTTATIPTGACAERWKFSSFCIYGCFIGTVMYPIFGNWVWGGGWLSQLGSNLGIGHGYVDFAGSSVVHMQGGVIGLIFGWLIGPRIGKYNKDGSVNPMPAHNIPMAIAGTFILAFGWFGFNPGSTLSGTDLRISVVAVNTMIASATGCMGSMLWMWWVRTKKPDPSMCCNGMLAGLVAITCPCAFVDSVGAAVIGLVSGLLVVEAVFFFDKLKIDDPVGAISVHGINGAWGCLSLGLFGDGAYGGGWGGVHTFFTKAGEFKMMDPTAAGKGDTETGVIGLLYGGGFGQLEAQIIGVVTCFITLSILSFIVFKIVTMLSGGTQRPTAEVEIEGLDIPEMGVLGYSGMVMDKASETPTSK
jgi:Amt family ammonium transporter